MTLKRKRPRSYHPARILPKGEIPTSRVKQEFKKEVNINFIVERMKRGIQPPPWMTSATPHYGDFSNMPTSLTEAFQIMEKAEEAFASLPLEFRRELDHDPRNLERAPKALYERFGLLKKAPGGTSGTPEGSAGAHLPPGKKSPANEPPGAKKGTPKVPDQKSDED
nr:MAG: internal scaffolding protein [Microvirus sp.]